MYKPHTNSMIAPIHTCIIIFNEFIIVKYLVIVCKVYFYVCIVIYFAVILFKLSESDHN